MHSKPAILINCDLGEGEPRSHSLALLDRIDCANFACGVHAGNVDELPALIEAAMERGVRVGAHPGMAGAMGRAIIDHMDTLTFNDCVAPQIDAFIAACEIAGYPTEKIHAKLHGNLYHLTEASYPHAEKWIEILMARLPSPTLIALAGGNVVSLAAKKRCRAWSEAFLDRAYCADGKLLCRGQPGAIIDGESAARARIALLRSKQEIQAIDGSMLALTIDTLCVHGDTPNAIAILDSIL
jgi:UPF0271 protein